MAAQGVNVSLEEYHGTIHGFTALPLPEGRRSRRRLRALVDTTLTATPLTTRAGSTSGQHSSTSTSTRPTWPTFRHSYCDR